MAIKSQISYDDFEKVDIRVGKVVKVEDFGEARKLSYKVLVDFGEEIGVKQSSAQIVKNQKKEELLGSRVICVVNFAPKQVGPFKSEVLILGAQDDSEDESNWVVLTTLKDCKIGGKIG